jgi:hypothetical protein
MVAPVLLAMVCLSLFSPSLHAEDKAYLVVEVRPDGSGELLLQSLQTDETGKKFKLALRPGEKLIDLAAAAEVPFGRVKKGDILFVTVSEGSRRLMIITPGQSVQRELAAAQPEEARTINGISRRLAPKTPPPSPVAGPPAAVSPDLDRVRRCFLFVMEFATGSPFTAAQERLILEQLQPAWWEAKSEAEKRSFGRYPQIVAWILQAGQDELEEMRSSLEATIRQWLKESPASDPVVAMVNARLQERGRIVFSGTPPLTEMAATAFSELYAYARLLQRNRSALPDRVNEGNVTEVRYDLLRVWSGFTPDERRQVATAPGLWLVLRTLIVHGNAAQRESAFRQLLAIPGIGISQQPSSPSVRSETNRQIMNSMMKHNVLMNIQTQTFNTYMWSRGFNYQPATGKMW